MSTMRTIAVCTIAVFVTVAAAALVLSCAAYCPVNLIPLP